MISEKKSVPMDDTKSTKIDALNVSSTNISKVDSDSKLDVHKSNSNLNQPTATTSRKCAESKSSEQILEQNLKDLLERKSREERRANGRLVAVIVTFLVIFVAVYHAWIRKTAVLAGILVPAAIMLGYGGWVMLLAKRDKRRRALFQLHIEEIALKNKAEMEAKIKQAKLQKKERKGPHDLDKATAGNKPSATATAMASAMVMATMTTAATTKSTTLHYENEMNTQKQQQQQKIHTTGAVASGSDSCGGGDGNGNGGSSNRTHRKQRKKHKHHDIDDTHSSSSSGSYSSSSTVLLNTTNNHKSHANKNLRVKRPSIRQKLFKQNASSSLSAQVKLPELDTIQKQTKQQEQLLQTKRKKVPRMSSLP